MEICSSIHLLLLSIVLVVAASSDRASAAKKSYIVYLGGHSHGREATLEDCERATHFHHEFLEIFLGSKDKAQESIIYSYRRYINGFAAFLDEEEALQISKHPRVVSIFRNKLLQLHTTRSWDMVDLERDGRVPPMSIWARAKAGQDIIIGNLDTGVWPESKSFSDEGIGPVPSRWKGSCQNDTNQGFPCNRKLIGAKCFHKGFVAEEGSFRGAKTPISARDTDGHGTHTLSTAGGAFVPGANLFGCANGTAKGGSPNARVAAYKVCWVSVGCAAADILSGFEEAIHDGVDVLSVSLGGYSSDYMTDPVAIGALHAVLAGVPVICSAGNFGPTAGSVFNDAPWIMTVGASTMDREIISVLKLGNNKLIKGESASSVTLPAGKMFPMIYGEDAKSADASQSDAETCLFNSLDSRKTRGKIVICLYDGMNNKLVAGDVVLKASGVGMVLVNDQASLNNTRVDPHVLPATHISFHSGTILRAYMNSTKAPMGYISAPKTLLGAQPAPAMTDFSSRGPSINTPQVIKPDLTAPGAAILAAYSQAASLTGLISDNRRVSFNLLYGTSMSCPHVSGVAGLVKALHPNWSPAAIRSAIMTSARTRDNTKKPMKDHTLVKTDAFAYGSGHIRPNRAMDPGLVYDIDTNSYLDVLCALGYNSSIIATFNKKPYKCPSTDMKLEELNYPSIAAPNLINNMTITRTVKNVGNPGTYRARVEAPFGITVSVKPEILKFEKVGEEKAFEIYLKASKVIVGTGYAFGRLIWSDGKHYVRSPIAVNVMT